MNDPLLDLYRRYFKLVRSRRKVDDLCEQISRFPLAQREHARLTVELEIALRQLAAVEQVCLDLEHALTLAPMPHGIYAQYPMARVVKRIREALNGDT